MNPVDQNARLHCSLGRMLNQQRRWAAAEEAGRRAVEIVDQSAARMDTREADLFLVEALAVWGKALGQLGRPGDAAVVLRRALSLAGAYPGEPSRIVAACTDLAQLCQSTGNFLEAETLVRRALALMESSGGMAATLYRHLAALEHARGDYQRGLTAARKACQMRAKVAGPDDPEAVADRLVLAGLYAGLGNYKEARSMYAQALETLERIHGSEHYDVAACLNKMAALEQAEGRLDESVSLHRRAMAIEEKLLGALHPDTIATVRKIAQVVQERGRAAQARRAISRALDKVRACPGCVGMPGCCRL